MRAWTENNASERRPKRAMVVEDRTQTDKKGITQRKRKRGDEEKKGSGVETVRQWKGGIEVLFLHVVTSWELSHGPLTHPRLQAASDWLLHRCSPAAVINLLKVEHQTRYLTMLGRLKCNRTQEGGKVL